VYLITCTPVYLPGNEHIVLNDFESGVQTAPDAAVVPLDSWAQSTHGVIREHGSGFSGSACIKLTAQGDKPVYVRWTLRNPQDYQFLRLRAKMRTEGVVRGAHSWNTARVLLYFTDKSGKINWDYPHAAGSLTGTTPWKEFEKIFPVPELAATATVVVQNSSTAGSLWCDDIALSPVFTNSSYFILRGILFFAAVVLAISAIGLFGLLKKGGWIPLAILVMILAGVLCSQYYLEMIAGAFGLKIFWLKKTGHVVLFFLLGLAATSWAGATKKASGRVLLSLKQLACIFLLLLSFAALTELLQLATLDRGPGAFDFFINTAGSSAGMASACLVFWIKQGKMPGGG
jgi:hypothetical protein